MLRRQRLMDDVETVKIVIQGTDTFKDGEFEHVAHKVARRFRTFLPRGDDLDNILTYSNNEISFNIDVMRRGKEVFSSLFNFESGALAENFARDIGLKPLSVELQKGVKTITLAPDLPEDRRIILTGTDRLTQEDQDKMVAQLRISNAAVLPGNNEIFIDFKARLAEMSDIKARMLEMGIRGKVSDTLYTTDNNTKAYVRREDGRMKPIHTLVGKLPER